MKLLETLSIIREDYEDFISNPTMGRIQIALERSKRKLLRGLVAGNEFHIWDAAVNTHDEGIQLLGHQGEVYQLVIAPKLILVQSGKQPVDPHRVPNEAFQMFVTRADRAGWKLMGADPTRMVDDGESLRESKLILSSMPFWYQPESDTFIEVDRSHAEAALRYIFDREPDEDDLSDEGQDSILQDTREMGWVRGIVSPAELELDGSSWSLVRRAGVYIMERIDYIPNRYVAETNEGHLILDAEQFDEFLRGKQRFVEALDPALDAFMADLEKYPVNPLNHRETYIDGCLVQVYPFGGKIHLGKYPRCRAP